MAEIAGKVGLLKEGSNTLSGGRNWSIDAACDTLDSTDFSDSGARTFIAGLTSWSGSMEFLYQGSAPPVTLGTTYTLHAILDDDNSKEYSGSAIITGCNPSVAVDGIEVYAVSFQGSGTLTAPS